MTQDFESKNDSLKYLGLETGSEILWNLHPAELVQRTLLLGQGSLASNGALCVDTGYFKGRSPQDRFIVKDEVTSEKIDWTDPYNLPFESENFDHLYNKLISYFSAKQLFVRDVFACADHHYRKSLRVITEFPWSSLFAYNIFIRPTETQLEQFIPEWHIICAPEFSADPVQDGTRAQNFSILNFTRKVIIIGGSGFTGEIKKGFFTVLNFILPTENNVLTMHCAANVGKNNDTALFLGLSGTGKTTLSFDVNRRLIGDDEHGWSDETVFNFEGGCYARTLNITRESEPQIYDSIKFGALLENIGFMPDLVTPNYRDYSATENTRVSFPLDHVREKMELSVGWKPNNIFFLTCDAFGVLPPISKLTKAQAMYYFLSGYSAKLPGSEVGISEPTAVFVACFGAPFLPLPHTQYAKMLGNKIEETQASVWLINTGWVGGPFGVGERIKLEVSRAIVTAVLEGQLSSAEFDSNNIFKLLTPSACPGVPTELLVPSKTWKNEADYNPKALELIQRFSSNFSRYRNYANQELLNSDLKSL